MIKPIYLLLVGISSLSFGQQINIEEKVSFSVFAGAGRAVFNTSPSGPSRFPAFEARVGGAISYNISRLVSADGRVIFGVKRKRDPMNVPGQPYGAGPQFLTVDEVASKRDHYFFEVPLTLKFEFPHPAIGLRLGANYRFFAPDNNNVDFLTNRSEVGLIAGGYWKVNSKFNLGLDQYFGITKLYTSFGFINGADSELILRNRFVQIYLEYKLSR